MPNKPESYDTAPRRTIHQHVPAPYTRVNPKDTPPAVQPISRRTRSHTQNTQPPIALRTRDQLQQALRVTPYQEYERYFPKALLALWSTPVTDVDMPVLNNEIGENLEYRQLRHHTEYQKIWEESYCNELGRLWQSIGTGEKGLKKKRVAGTETFRIIRYEDVPANRRKEITYTKIVCKVRPQKDDPNRTRITISGNKIIYPGDVATPTASLKLLKIIINSVLPRHGAKFACFELIFKILPPPLIDQNMRK